MNRAHPGPSRGIRPKLVLLRLFKAAGLFRLARALTRRDLRILCYHGFASADEASFRPQLFIRPATFRSRLERLRSGGYRILPLGEALEAMDAGRLPDDAVVITVDDGFHNFRSLAFGILREYAFPSTVYVTTYYMAKRKPVFRLAAQYLFWKAGRGEVDRADLGLPPGEGGEARIGMWDLIRLGEGGDGEEARQSLLRSLGKALGQDAEGLAESRMLSLMTPEEVREIADGGVDVQLHTHRHRLPLSAPEAEREIRENREALLAAGVPRPDHFCYPSGIWDRGHWPILSAAGVASSTTCEPGFNRPGVPRHALRRFLDSESIADIEFEAELCGFLELLRILTGKARRIAAKTSSAG